MPQTGSPEVDVLVSIHLGICSCTNKSLKDRTPGCIFFKRGDYQDKGL